MSMLIMRENFKKPVCELVTGDRNKKSNDDTGFACSDCGRVYKLRSSLRNHRKWECGKEARFKCSFCEYKAKQKIHMRRHIERIHSNEFCSLVKTDFENT
uniref:C2H2-type domain-containing protein n=3 Tax=Photinus pyralis TaxID=7054 RepID=A0A1Y1LN27_PHOPY